MQNIKEKYYFIDESNREICAGGVILYKKIDSDIHLLLINSRGGYEDFGGGIDANDNDIYETVAREAEEESNGLLKKADIMKRLVKTHYMYNARSKYVVFFIKATDNEKTMTSEMFGSTELHDDIPRTVEWLSAKEFFNLIAKKQLNFRIVNKEIFAEINRIREENGYSNAKKIKREYMF